MSASNTEPPTLSSANADYSPALAGASDSYSAGGESILKCGSDEPLLLMMSLYGTGSQICSIWHCSAWC